MINYGNKTLMYQIYFCLPDNHDTAVLSCTDDHEPLLFIEICQIQNTSTITAHSFKYYHVPWLTAFDANWHLGKVMTISRHGGKLLSRRNCIVLYVLLRNMRFLFSRTLCVREAGNFVLKSRTDQCWRGLSISNYPVLSSLVSCLPSCFLCRDGFWSFDKRDPNRFSRRYAWVTASNVIASEAFALTNKTLTTFNVQQLLYAMRSTGFTIQLLTELAIVAVAKIFPLFSREF